MPRDAFALKIQSRVWKSMFNTQGSQIFEQQSGAESWRDISVYRTSTCALLRRYIYDFPHLLYIVSVLAWS